MTTRRPHHVFAIQACTTSDVSRSAVTIEKVNPSNFNDFFRLIGKLAQFEHHPLPDEKARKRLREGGLSDNPNYEAYLGFTDGKPIACVTVYLSSTCPASPTFFLENIFVLEEYRKTGVGSEMFRFCQEEAKKRGCEHMEWRVHTWNVPAIRFYEQCGGKCIDRIDTWDTLPRGN
ncbi:MAG: GNAT family N-acetyltransferase [Methanoregulaceae archaeon]|nr:GNAT family N-acetyltransferase [Methanoregulaceae archaeon]